MDILPDIIALKLRLLICGYNAGPESARQGHYFANPQHRFWRTLHEVGITPRVLKPSEDQELLHFGVGLTDLLKKSVHGDGRAPTNVDRDELHDKILRYRPRVIAFLGKQPVLGFLGQSTGWGLSSVMLGETRIAVVPDPSPANGHFQRLKRHWLEIVEVAQCYPD